jgi:hypothetical protein
MEKILLVVVGLSCLLSSGLVLFKVASRDGEPVYSWLEKDGAAVAVSLAVMTAGSLGLALLIQALAG